MTHSRWLLVLALGACGPSLPAASAPGAPSSPAPGAAAPDDLANAMACARIRSWTVSFRDFQGTLSALVDVQPLHDVVVAQSLRRIAADGDLVFAAGPPDTAADRKVVRGELAKLLAAMGDPSSEARASGATREAAKERGARALAAEQSAFALERACRGDYAPDCAAVRGLLPYLPAVSEPDAARWKRYLDERKKVHLGGTKVPALLEAVDRSFGALHEHVGSAGDDESDAYDFGVASGKQLGVATTRIIDACAAFPDTRILPVAKATDAQSRQAVVRVQARAGAACAGALRALGHPVPDFDDAGSGFVVEAPGGRAVITNHHVVEHASALRIVHPRFAAPLPVRVRLLSRGFDVAILDADAQALGPGLSLLSAMPERDQPVRALGYPGYAAEHALTATSGVVSKPSAPLNLHGTSNVYVQHSALVRPGNSGGPLLDADGQVVGLNTFYLGARPELSLALPATVVRLLLVAAFVRSPRVPSPREGCRTLVNAAHRREVAGLMSEDLELEWEHDLLSAVDANLASNGATPCAATRSVAAGALQALLDEAGGISSTETCDAVPDSGSSARFELVTRSGRRLHASMAFAADRWELTALR